jgi:hypothetical protein
MKNSIVAICLALLLSGCSTLPATVEVPIPVPCTPPPQVTRPHLAVGRLRPDSPAADVVKAYETTLEELAGYALYLETLLNGYRGAGNAR